MKKICLPSPPMRKRRPGLRHPASKVGKLEEKLDGLVTLLRSATSGTPGILNVTSINSAVEELRPSSHGQSSGSSDGCFTFNRTLDTAPVVPNSAFTPAASSTSSSASASMNLPPLPHPDLEPSPEDAESYLIRFRTEFIKHLPFIVISPSMTAHQLRQESPFLWLSVMTVASTRSSQQIALSKEVRAIFGREAYLEGTRTIDLLLAVLTYATWDRRYGLDKPILTSLGQLAIAILYDLVLDKPSSSDPGLMLDYDLKDIRKPSRLSRPPTLEERRVLLGCFLLSSVPSFARRGESLRWTAYCDECVLVLEQEKEFPSDELLIQLVKLRLINEKVVGFPHSGAPEGGGSTRLSAILYLKSLQAQLRTFKSSFLTDLTDDKSLLLELYNTELCIHEIGFSHAPDLFTGQSNQRFECLFACLQALKSWINVFLSIPPAQYVGFSASIYAQLTRGLIDVWRLSTCEYPEWDRGLVRENLDVSMILGQIEKNFAQVKEAAGLDVGCLQGSDFFSIMASKTRSIRVSWDAITAPSTDLFDISSLDELGGFSTEFLDIWIP
ncbi:hypothetical protein MMC17_001923 [Xylographa soralifera]|nr:hypothetical protein [Xylographa soralifera]